MLVDGLRLLPDRVLPKLGAKKTREGFDESIFGILS
jgi:hypothetical protein